MTKTFFARTSAACAAVITGLGLTAAAPALAKVHSQPSSRRGSRVVEPVHMLASGVPTSSIVGGYVLSPTEGITTVSSTFKLPIETCPVTPTTTTGALALGEALSTSAGGGVQPSQYQDAYAQITLYCYQGGQPAYDAAAGNDSGQQYFNASGGDVIQTRIAETPSGQTIETVSDLTSGAQINDSGPTDAADTQIILGSEAGATAPASTAIPKFSKVTFTNVQVGGLDWSQTSPAPTPYALNQDGYYNSTQIVPSNVPAKPSTTFTLTERSDQ